MAANDREKIHFELLEALYTARKQVEALEAALAHNAAFLGTGVERKEQIGRAAPEAAGMPNALMRYLELVEPEEDISNFIGREGHDESRPRLGTDAPDEVRPDKTPAVSPLVGQLAFGHPDDGINFGLPLAPMGGSLHDAAAPPEASAGSGPESPAPSPATVSPAARPSSSSSIIGEEAGTAPEAGEGVQAPLSLAWQSRRPLELLVVEDDPVSQFTLRALLKKDGYDCACVSNGRQALEALMLRIFDCVITDIQMPVMDGMELTQRIREGETEDIKPSPQTAALVGINAWDNALPVPRDIPIIALTAYAMTGDRERFLGMGGDYYLAKPLNAAELSVMLAHVSTLLHARKGE